jgi:malonyl-CoA O-methyltransferase
MLQWLNEPCEALERWRGWLKPRGHLYVALPVEGSFREWRDVCRNAGVEDGLWLLPSETFADGLAASQSIQNIQITYPTATDFLKRLKTIGAATPRPNHKVFNSAVMRSLLAAASVPFSVTYRILTMQLLPQDGG